MTRARALEEKMQSKLGLPEAMAIETNLAVESKEEKPVALAAAKKYKASSSAKTLVEDLVNSLLLCSKDPEGKLIPCYSIPKA